MSFVDVEDVISLSEGLASEIFKNFGIDVPLPLPRLTYNEAMERYGSDKPDTRFGFELKKLTDITRDSGFGAFKNAKNVYGISVSHEFSRKEIDALTAFVKGLNVKGLAWHKGESSSFAKFLSDEEMSAICDRVGFEPGSTLFAIADDDEGLAQTSLGALRLECARRMNLLNPTQFNFLWVTDFPMFDYDEEEGRYVAQHHLFTAPADEDIHLLDQQKDLSNVRSKAYDIVCNGYEIGGGSIRIHDATTQSKVFTLLGLSEEEAETRFGHMLKAFSYGVPPHGGLAFGFDRICMLLCETQNIRDVIAFPKTQSAVEPMTGCPSTVDQKQLDELNIALKP